MNVYCCKKCGSLVEIPEHKALVVQHNKELLELLKLVGFFEESHKEQARLISKIRERYRRSVTNYGGDWK